MRSGVDSVVLQIALDQLLGWEYPVQGSQLVYRISNEENEVLTYLVSIKEVREPFSHLGRTRL